MSRLDDALARFGEALSRLEASARQQPSTDGGVELSDLREERERLVARVASLEEESRMLAGLTEEVEGRLDGAIAEIREVLRHN
jgi:hypothetical protein